MSEQDARHRQAWELLPWYVNGTLSGQDLDLVTGHLSGCAACAEEVARCRDLAVAVGAMSTVQTAPSAERLARLLARIDAIEAGGGTGGWREWVRRSIDGLRELLQSTPAPTRWALAAQSALVVVLVATVAWQMAVSPSYRTLASGADPVARGRAQIRVVFAEDISEREMRAVLARVDGRIIDGPSTVGAYTVQVPVPAAASDQVTRELDLLRSQPKVRLAEPIRSR
jgi:anti-sigma factor RsiW